MNITKHKYAFVALAAFSLAALLPTKAEYYWLLSGNLMPNAGQRSDLNGNGLGCWLELTNDVAGVDYNPVKVYDIRRKTTGGTDLVKWGEGSTVEPFPGCRYGEAVVDFSLPIRGADGTSYRLVQVSSYQGCNFLGKLVLTNSIASLDNQCFRNNYYLREVVMPDPATWQPTAITRAFEGCSRLESAIVWPDNLDKVSQYTFSGNSSMAGFSGKGVKTYEAGAFHSVPSTFRLEMSEADTISFTGQAINNNNISTVVWHGTPPSTGDYFSKSSNNFMPYSKTSRVHYIPIRRDAGRWCSGQLGGLQDRVRGRDVRQLAHVPDVRPRYWHADRRLVVHQRPLVIRRQGPLLVPRRNCRVAHEVERTRP